MVFVLIIISCGLEKIWLSPARIVSFHLFPSLPVQEKQLATFTENEQSIARERKRVSRYLKDLGAWENCLFFSWTLYRKINSSRIISAFLFPVHRRAHSCFFTPISLHPSTPHRQHFLSLQIRKNLLSSRSTYYCFFLSPFVCF